MLVNPIELLALDIDGVITDGKVCVGAHGEETKGIAFRDLDALAKARREGLKLALVTGETGALQAAIAERLNADLVLSGAKDKVLALRTLSEEMAVPLASICFVGDADRDALAFSIVGLALCPADASPAARAKAHRVLESRGGEGAVAEAVELVLCSRAAQRRMPEHERALKRIVEDSIRAHEKLLAESLTGLAEIAELLANALRTGHKILFCGSGGSGRAARRGGAGRPLRDRARAVPRARAHDRHLDPHRRRQRLLVRAGVREAGARARLARRRAARDLDLRKLRQCHRRDRSRALARHARRRHDRQGRRPDE